MCITTNKASLSNTRILSLALDNGRHFMTYSNRAKNDSNKPNAMILPIPGKTRQELFHDTTDYKDFLGEIIEKASRDEWMGGDSFGRRTRSAKGFKKFNLGMYTIGLADSFLGAEEFIASLSEEKRPKLSEELAGFFREKYAGYSFAVCCFDSGSAMDAQPIALEYEPLDPDVLFFPTVDGHDGRAPRLRELVPVDHTFIFEHEGKMVDGLYHMDHIELYASVPEFLNKRRYRFVNVHDLRTNGDTTLRRSIMRSMDLGDDPELVRSLPEVR